jgi:lipopolysaccharide transport system ATP-binding protein
MSRPVIEVEGLCKEFIIGTGQRSGETLRDLLMSSLAAPFPSLRPIGGKVAAEERIWALKDVSFTVDEGEVVGIIGRNGAGKSTLLKVLSRITAPTEGRVTIRGRIGSLLEVGTGFHPELTGRENIFLNGAILGMKRKEIESKFDEIVDFSGVEKFIDTPVKRYSSGMHVRLAFAVAAYLDPEILLVDEVLAVGDAEFQRKCLGKMDDVAKSGRTVIFVSHTMSAIENLCSAAILLAGGTIAASGATQDIVSQYLKAFDSDTLEFRPSKAPVKLPYRLTRIRLCDDNNQPLKSVSVAQTPVVEIECEVDRQCPQLKVAFVLHDQNQNPIFASSPPDTDMPQPVKQGTHRYRAHFPGPILRPQRYSVTVSLYANSADESHICWHAISFDAADARSPLIKREINRMGVINQRCDWQHIYGAAKRNDWS